MSTPTHDCTPLGKLGNQHLLLPLDLLDKLNRNVESLGDNVGGSEGEPLAKGDVRHAVRFVDLDPDEVFSVRGVLDVVASHKLA